MPDVSPRSKPQEIADLHVALEEHRAGLMGHCYRMLGSAADADDAVQETMVRAWRGFERFEGRSSVQTWLYRIATRVCLDALADRGRRERPSGLGPAGTVDTPLIELPASRWVGPVLDAQVLPQDANPAELAMLRQSIRLAFIALLQHLPPKQRAVLLLTEVLGWAAAEVAESLDTTVAAVNSALQRARATLSSRDPERAAGPLSAKQSSLLERYVLAFEKFDLDGLTHLLHEDAALSMPPYSAWFRGRDSIRSWLLGPGSSCRGSRLLPTAANGSPAFGQYRPSGPGGLHEPWALVVLELSGDRIAGMDFFLDTEELFPRFGLPPALPPGS